MLLIMRITAFIIFSRRRPGILLFYIFLFYMKSAILSISAL